MPRGLPTYADALEWLQEHWTPREVPAQINTHVNEGWGLFFTLPMERHLDAKPSDLGNVTEARNCSHPRNTTGNVWECPDCQGMEVYQSTATRYRFPMWRAMEKLSAFDRANPPRPGLPGATACIYALVIHSFDGRKAARHVIASTERGSWEVAEPLFLMAIRRLFGRYEEGPVQMGWVSKSEAQRNAEVAA